MYRTDKQFMTNPATAASRIYIGGLAKTIVAADLEEKFKMHGKILGLVQQMGFAFIQYENESQAQAAIKNESNTMLHGRKICVRQALDKSQKGANNAANQAQNRRVGPSAPPPPQVHGDPPLQVPPQSFSKPVEEPPKPVQKTEFEKELQEHLPSASLSAAPKNPPNVAQKNPPPLPEESPKNDGPPEKRSRKRRVRSRDRFQQPVDLYRDEPYYGREDYPPAPYNNHPPVIDQPDRNDCEIIVVSKPLTKYAEYIEQRLKTLGLIVDLLFPNEDVPIGRVLANISSRGCLYAILIMPQNEEHRSLTLNILHGIPQEHRNMPIEDALVLITRNFDAYMRGEKPSNETLGPGGVLNISDRHPTSMQLLLNLLAENRQITTVQYDKLLKYLQERRELQHQHEVAEGVDQESQESNSKQAELQSRIMNILNKAATDNPPPPPETLQSNDVAPPLLKDPSVQKALDSLLGGEMFKNISVAL
ncbi:uncharacterized protein BDFB_003984 [Asbolus verrucosus]|uniref:RRM domain-containing protein n=1 Tax=Asbolus verrucosus TaxID=1661398 RepID=A0A482W437_ASBVE|nr:uncharacterized protein BDFB_003984 [Asbolus verrucosus]